MSWILSKAPDFYDGVVLDEDDLGTIKIALASAATVALDFWGRTHDMDNGTNIYDRALDRVIAMEESVCDNADESGSSRQLAGMNVPAMGVRDVSGVVIPLCYSRPGAVHTESNPWSGSSRQPFLQARSYSVLAVLRRSTGTVVLTVVIAAVITAVIAAVIAVVATGAVGTAGDMADTTQGTIPGTTIPAIQFTSPSPSPLPSP